MLKPKAMICIIPTNGLRWLNANDSHKSIFAKRTLAKEWRSMAGIYARSYGVPTYKRAHVTVYVHRTNNGTADVLNWADTVKPVIDGFTDAGCWPNDDNEHLTVDIREGGMTKSGKPMLELVITPVPDGWDTPPARRAKLLRIRQRKLLRRLDSMVNLNSSMEPTEQD